MDRRTPTRVDPDRDVAAWGPARPETRRDGMTACGGRRPMDGRGETMSIRLNLPARGIGPGLILAPLVVLSMGPRAKSATPARPPTVVSTPERHWTLVHRVI